MSLAMREKERKGRETSTCPFVLEAEESKRTKDNSGLRERERDKRAMRIQLRGPGAAPGQSTS